MIRTIVGFHCDEDGDWVAELSCSHAQHVRHQPPFWDREWVLSQEGRAARIGTQIECPLCEPEIVTVGHGTAEAEAFSVLLREARVELVVDIRRFPGSRRHPHFGTDQMAKWLPEAGVQYTWFEALGGRRKGPADSPHTGLRNLQFRAYADYMESEDFQSGAAELADLAQRRRLAVMCSESVWWRCHRRLLADYLVLAAGWKVKHLFHDGREADHPVTPGARLVDGQVRYDPVPETT